MEYIQIRDGLQKYELVPATDDVYKYVKDHKRNYYRSIFKYNEEHFKLFKQRGSVAGIRDVTTDSLLFDFDSKDLDKARLDTLKLCQKLLSGGVPEDDIKICFSGGKGFHVEVVFDRKFTHEEFKAITKGLASDLETFDTAVNDPNRIIRLEFTRHEKTGLYKTPFSLNELKNKSIQEIKDLSSSFDEFLFEDVKKKKYKTKFSPALLPKEEQTTLFKKEVTDVIEGRLDFRNKPKGFSNCKFALLNGYFEEGNRSNAIIRLAATCRAAGFPKHTAFAMCDSAAMAHSSLTGEERLTEREVEQSVNQVFSPTWQGGQYTCKTDGYLQSVCNKLGDNKCQHEPTTETFYSTDKIFKDFEEFAKNIDENTIKTGLSPIDSQIKLTTSMLVGILGSPGSGKTSWAIDILKYTSKHDIPSVFLSLDMAQPIIIQKLLMKETGTPSDDIFDIFKDGETDKINEYEKLLAERYKNVMFDFKSGQSVSDIKEKILVHQEHTGKKVKLLVVDYLECLRGESLNGDPTANTALIANQLKDLCNDLNICIILILQPQKTSGDVSEPIRSMRQVKGASTLEQAMSVLFGIYREGFNPKRPEDDRFLTINVLKNRMGPLLSRDFYWEGLRGEINNIDVMGMEELDGIRKRKIEEKKNSTDRWFE